MMNIEELSKPIPIEDIDFRVQSVNKGGYVTILAYKNARVDINRLNAACGPLGWERSHSRDNRNCTVSVWDDKNEHWVSKEDTGTESNADALKGLASDSFKRACFNWGIGIELYDYPTISIRLNGGKDNKKDEWYMDNGNPKVGWGFGLKQWTWESSFSDDGTLTYLSCKDTSGKLRFEYKCGNSHTPGDDISPDKIDLAKVERAYTYISTQINDDELEEDELIKRLKNAKFRLSPDELIKVNSKLKLVKFGDRQLNTLFADYIKDKGEKNE